ncbi:LasR-specific antiactivator QslA [Metapseudomonas boanensis]|nr:LasR-specific antiactivator QslA [Pseudomonas boanensis]
MTTPPVFPKPDDFPDDILVVDADSPAEEIRALGTYRLVQVTQLIQRMRTLCAKGRQEAQEFGMAFDGVEALLMDAHLKFEQAASKPMPFPIQDDSAGLKVEKLTVIPATAHCRELPLNLWQARHVDDLQRGMSAAETCLKQAKSSPWASFMYLRDRVPAGRPRNAFEAGFLIRMYQRMQRLEGLLRSTGKDR